MAKIAICFSGAIRYFYICIPFIKKYLIDSLNADIFLHAWKVDDCTDLDVSFKLKKTHANDKDVINILKPKKYVIEEYTSKWERKIREKTGIHWDKFKSDKDKNYANNACSMYYKIMRCNKLKCEYEKENNFTYDVVIRARTDFIFTDYVYLSDIINVKKNKMIILSDRFNSMWKSFRYCNDKFFMGSSSLMDDMCNLFDKIDEYYKSNKCKIEGQSLFKYHSNKCCNKIIKINDKYTYYKCQDKQVSYFDSNKSIRINNINSELTEALSFNFLSCGMRIVSDDANDKLKLFKTFFVDKERKAKTNYELELNENTITIHNINENIEHNIVVDNIYNSKKEIYDDTIFYEELFDFILSVMLYSKEKVFICNKSSLINPKIKDTILCHIPDRGIFFNEIKDVKENKYIPKKILYKENFISRKAIKIKKIYKNYSKGILPSNYSKDDLIKKYTKMQLNNLFY